MTTHHISPEDAFDRWLDALVDDEHLESDDERADTAMFLQRHFALPPAETASVIGPAGHLARRAEPSEQDAPARESSKRLGIVPVAGAGAGWHIASLASVAVLILIAIGMIGALLRMGDDDPTGGVSATASMLPFAPSPALASPTPAVCTTDDTLLLVPEGPVAPGAFDDVAFPVAWFADGTLTVERHGEVHREIEIGDFPILQPTPVPNVIHAFETRADGGSDRAAFVNIATGETVEIGTYQRIILSDGPYAFWVSDDAHTHWHVIDLRSFETTDLNEAFDITPLRAWTPWVTSLRTSDDGAVMLVGTTILDTVNRPIPGATPIASDGPELEIGRDALLIDGNLDTISVIGPLAPTSGDMTTSPDGQTAAWLAPSDTPGTRTLVIQDTASGELLAERPIDATYSNSLLFSADGLVLYATHDTTLERIAVHPAAAPPTAPAPIELPDTGYRIVGASPDRTKLLLDRPGSGASEVSLWIDLGTGDIRELEGAPGRLWVSTSPLVVASQIADHILLDDLQSQVMLLDMHTGEIVITIEGDAGTGTISISNDHSTLAIPGESGIDLLDLTRGTTTTHPIPDEAEGFLTPLTFSLTSEGSCLAGSWWLDDSADTLLLSATDERSLTLPSATVGGWVPSDAP